MLFDSVLPELTPCHEAWAPQAGCQHPVPPPAPRSQGGAGGSPFSTQKFQTSKDSDPPVMLGTLYEVPYTALSVPSCRTGALFAKLYKHPGLANSPCQSQPLPSCSPSPRKAFARADSSLLTLARNQNLTCKRENMSYNRSLYSAGEFWFFFFLVLDIIG